MTEGHPKMGIGAIQKVKRQLHILRQYKLLQLCDEGVPRNPDTCTYYAAEPRELWVGPLKGRWPRGVLYLGLNH